MEDTKAAVINALRGALARLAPEAADIEILIERPRDPAHGDFATNLAMQLAKRLKRKPRELAEALAAELRAALGDRVTSVDVAGAGFINLRLAAHAKQAS